MMSTAATLCSVGDSHVLKPLLQYWKSMKNEKEKSVHPFGLKMELYFASMKKNAAKSDVLWTFLSPSCRNRTQEIVQQLFSIFSNR